ncbi:MAG: 16S rRNA (cytosine(1402)-N(4))-methyltransferase RsmH [Phycisphaerae bacterium]|nr:16S rRNA (cytosine(1402)-N(4))-methyltransferase RsmH [Phycisphaerae bacterium]
MQPTGDNPTPHRRRPRYRGTHPRRFDERYKELRPEQFPQMQQHIREQGRTPAGSHVPIMVAEVMDCLSPQPGETIVDCTVGYGGHAGEFLRRIGPTGKLIGLDVDAGQVARTRDRLAALGGRVSLHHMNFAGVAKALRLEGLADCDAIFADLGVSSMQIDDPARGFSYKHDGPLDMRMDPRTKRTAADLLAEMSFEELAAALEELSDEPEARLIAEAIVRQRERRPIRGTRELSEIVLAATGVRKPAPGSLHPAARTFQALRILVNDELGRLRELLRVAPFCLRAGGRIAILTFHSGEERLVEQAFRAGVESGVYAATNEDVIRPAPQEVHDNPRSSAAKLRWARRE